MAAIYQRGRVWWARVQREGIDIRESLETTSRNAAEKRLIKWLAGLETHAGKKPTRLYNEAMDSFVREHLPTLQESTQARYLISAKHLTDHFEDRRLDQITSARLAEFEASRRQQGVGSPTIRRDLMCLSAMFTHVIVDLEWCDINPVSAFLKRQSRRGRLRESPPRTRYLSHEEELVLLAAADYEFAGQMAFAIDTGLRKSELWSLERRQIQNSGTEVWIPAEKAKGGREKRMPLLARSAQWLAQSPRYIVRGDEPDWVFRKANGGRYGERRKAFLAAIEGAGLKDLIWHDLRRTCGCRLLQDHDMEMKKVSDWLGHRSVGVTERSYAFLTVDNLHTAIRGRHNVGTSKKKNAGQEIDK